MRVCGACGGLADVIDEGEGGPRADAEGRPRRVEDVSVVVGTAEGQCVGHGVEVAPTVLNGEVKAKELADPLMLWHGGEALVQQELEAVVIRANTERPPQKYGRQ